jgi:hypothetical protein
MNTMEKAEQLFLDFKVKEAYSLFQKLSEEGNGRAFYFLALYNILPLGISHGGIGEAQGFLHKGSQLGDPLSQYEEALFMSQNGEKKDIRPLFEKVKDLADKGDVFAMDEVPECLFTDRWGLQDIDKGLSYLKEAADKGNWMAASDLGDEYFQKRHIPQDFDKAFAYYKKAADKGFVYATDQLAFCYYRGTGTDVNHKKGMALWRKCASLGYAPSANALGFVLDFGPENERNEKEAFGFFLQAAKGGFPLGYGNAANCYYYGRGTKKDRRLARYWYQKGAEAGLNTSMMQLGVMMREDKRYDEAYQLFKKAAENGNLDAMGWLASCYSEGLGTKKDDGMALFWLKKAADGGSRDAAEVIARYFSHQA